METNNPNNIEFIINSLTDFSFEFEIEELKKFMELDEVPNEEIQKLGNETVNENFNKNIFKIKLPNGTIIDAESVYKHCAENNIKEPIIFINPNYKYVRWKLKKDFVNPQLKNKIRSQLKQNKSFDFKDWEKAILIDDTKKKEIVGYVDKLPIKTTEFIAEGKFIIQASCSKEYARKLIFETIQELKAEKELFVNRKIKRDKKNIFYYSLFIVIVSILWLLSKQTQIFEDWFLTLIAFFLFIIPLVVMRLINHSFFDFLLFRKKTEKKYENEYYNKLSIE